MFYTAAIQIDPTQITKIKNEPTDSFFKSLLNLVSLGSKDDKYEQETFTAVSIMNQIKSGLTEAGIDNVIKLAVDNQDYYLDKENQENDLEFAFSNLKFKIDPVGSKLFENINLVMEYLDSDFKYYIDININRKHKINEFPIKIKVIGLFKEFGLSERVSLSGIKQKLEFLFTESEYLETFVKSKNLEFNKFINKLYYHLGKFIEVDAIKKDTIGCIVRPNSANYTEDEIKTKHVYSNILEDYLGLYNYSLYLWYWSEMLHKLNINIYSVIIVDEYGNKIVKIGQIGFMAGNFNMLNPNIEFSVVKGAHLKYYGENMYVKTIIENGLLFDENSVKVKLESKEWLKHVYNDADFNIDKNNIKNYR